MILREELEKIARTNKKSLYHLEKSYLQTIVLQAIYSKTELVFKGGTALMMFAHLPRFSEDLDFTSSKAETIPIGKLLKLVQNELANYGIFSNIDNIKETEISNSFRIGAKGPLYESEKSISYLRIELSFREKVILPAKKEYLQPIFPDILPFFISFMDLREILAEKIRAIMKRNRARDIFDLWFLLIKGVKFDLNLVQSKLNYYNIQWDLNNFLECLNFSQKQWKRILQPIVWQKIPPFDQISNQISEIIKNQQ